MASATEGESEKRKIPRAQGDGLPLFFLFATSQDIDRICAETELLSFFLYK
jgi:hypothetical protein